MPNSMIQKDAREGKGSEKSLEKKWDRAKGAAGKDGGEQNWALTNYIYQKMTASEFTASPEVEVSATIRVAAYLSMTNQVEKYALSAGELTSGDLNTSQGDEPECNEPGAGGAPTSYEYQDEDNTPGVQEFDGPDCAEIGTHGDEVVYASEANLMYAGFAQYNMRVLAALGIEPPGVGATVSPSSMGTGSSPVEFQDSAEEDPAMGPAATPVPDEPVGVPEEIYSEPELPTGTEPKKPVEPSTGVEPVQPIGPKQAASVLRAHTDVITQVLREKAQSYSDALSQLNALIALARPVLTAEEDQRLVRVKDDLHDAYRGQ